MKHFIKKICAIVISIACMLTVSFPANAAQGTEGTELQVVQPSNLEVQLGTSWVGVEFMLRTDAGIYPGTIVVGEDGTLRLEIGGSRSYILSCLQSDINIPKPTLTQASATQGVETDNLSTEKISDKDDKAPRWPITVFAFGILTAVIALFVIYQYEQYRKEQKAEEDEQDEE